MNSRSAVVTFVVVIVAIVGAAIWFMFSPVAPHRPPAPAPAGATTTTTTTTSEPTVIPSKPTPPPPRVTKTPDEAPPQAPVLLSEDDRKIDEVLRAAPGNSDQANSVTAQNLISILPTLSPDGQVECAQHISNLISDTDYQKIMPFWKNPATNPDVIEVFATDMMNREDAIKLPAMLEAAKIANHPYQEEAVTNLEIFLDAEFGTDWAKWDAAIKGYLKKQAAGEQ